CTVQKADWRGKACDANHACPENGVCSADGVCIDPGSAGGGGGGGSTGGGSGGGVGGGTGGGGGSCDPTQLDQPCTAGQGTCAVSGVTACVNDAVSCSATPGTSSAEVCDGLDNDCDGTPDNNLTAPACTKTKGVCAGVTNDRVCAGDAGFSDCTYPSTYEAAETKCDGLDNDCNGIVDDVPGCLHTLASDSPAGYAEGLPGTSRFAWPSYLTYDKGIIYVADRDNHVIRSVPLDGGSSVLVAGTPGVCGFQDGPALSAKFCEPIEAVVAANGDLYVSDSQNNRIRKITPFGTVSTLAGSGARGAANGGALASTFNDPWGIFLASNGDLLIADYGNDRIRRWVSSSNTVVTESGSSNGNTEGTRSTMKYDGPSDVVLDSAGNLYTVEEGGDRVRVIAPGTTTTSVLIAGDPNGNGGYQDGVGTGALFEDPLELIIDEPNNLLYTGDRNNRAIRSISIDLDGGTATTVVRANSLGYSNGTGSSASGVGWGGFVKLGNSYIVADDENHVIRRVDKTSGTQIWQSAIVSDLHGVSENNRDADGPGQTAHLYRPWAGSMAADGYLYFAQTNSNLLRRITPTGDVETIIGNVTTHPGGYVDGPWASARVSGPFDVRTGPAGVLYFSESYGNRIRQLDPIAKTVTIYAGSTAGTAGTSNGTSLLTARFDAPTHLAFGKNPAGDDLMFITDSRNDCIRAIDMTTQTVSVYAGTVNTPGSANGAVGTGHFSSSVAGMAQDSALNLWVADNQDIRKVDTAGVLSRPTQFAGLGSVEDISIDGDTLYAVGANAYGGLIVKATLSTMATTIVMDSRGGYQDGLVSTSARAYGFTSVQALSDRLILVDRSAGRIRQLWR
ncbi:MAG: MopE-related protein, partial [Myxococcaceae bacterium]